MTDDCCGKPSDLYLCDDCLNALREDLTAVPWTIRELLTTATRETGIDYRAFSESKGTKASTPPVPMNFGALQARENLTNVLWAAYRVLDMDGKYKLEATEVPVPSVYAMLLYKHINDIAKHPDAASTRTAIRKALAAAHQLIDRRPDRWYAGPCDDCNRDLYAETDSGTVQCHECSRIYDVRDRRAHMLRSAEDRLADATTIARAVSWIGAEPVNPRRLRVWATRGKLKSVEQIEGRPVYRIGDVLDLLATHG